MAQESAFLAALAAARTFTLADNELTLIDAGGTTVARFTAQRQELADTSWQVAAYNDGRSAVVSVLGGTAPSVAFAADGTLSGDGGCNRFSGGFSIDAGGISVGPLASTRRFCTEPAGVMEQEAALLLALESAATYLVDRDSLTLRDASDATAVQLRRG